jgi:hypothetical protein
MGATQELGKTLASLKNEQTSMKEGMMPDLTDQELTLLNGETIKINLTVTGYARTYTDALIVGHPVYGEVYSYRVGNAAFILGHGTYAILGTCSIYSSVTYTTSTLFTYSS